MRTPRARHLVAYGTLMSTCYSQLGRFERDLIRQEASFIGAVSIAGRLYDAGACPAAILEPGGQGKNRFHGELWRVHGPLGSVLEALDYYEGFVPHSPQTSLYVRKQVRARTPDGRRVIAWLYEWNGSAAGLVRIPSGRWNVRGNEDLHAEMTCSNALASVGIGLMQPHRVHGA